MIQWINDSFNESVNHWPSESMIHWINASRNLWTNEFSKPHAPKVRRFLHFCSNFYVKSNSGYSLPTLSSKKGSDHRSFFCVCLVKRTRTTVSSSKSASNMPVFNMFKCKSSSRFFPLRVGQLPRSRPAPAETDTRLGRPQKKNAGFRIQKWLVVWNMTFIFPYIYIYIGKIIPTDELIFFRGVGIPPTRKVFSPTSQLITWQWLACRCGWHDGVNANHDHRP